MGDYMLDDLIKIIGKKGEKPEDKKTPETSESCVTSDKIKALLAKSDDIIFRRLFVGGRQDMPATLVYTDGLVDSKTIGDDVIKPLVSQRGLFEAEDLKEAIELMEGGFIYFPSQKKRDSIEDVITDILSGFCALIFDEEQIALTFETKGFKERSISEPTEENIVKGPKDVFVENIRVNTATLRRKIKNENLVIKHMSLGKQSKTSIAIVYIDGITNPSLIEKVKERLEGIDIDGVIEAGYIEEYIVDRKFATFPQIVSTERPDVVATNLLEGRVAVIADGIPVAFAVPGVISQFLRTPDDYSLNYLIVAVKRILRYTLMMVTIFLPAFYIAIVTFHQEMIPSDLALSIAASKEGVPYPAYMEVIFMLISFEVLLEGGLRLPKNIGQAVSIVGGLVVGEAAVNAKFISPAVVVVIAIAAIAGFTMPSQSFANSLRIWRFAMVILSSILGLVGMTFGAILLLFKLADMETFDVPYLAPFVGNDGNDLRDSIIRPPLYMVKNRPFMLRTLNKRRQK